MTSEQNDPKSLRSRDILDLLRRSWPFIRPYRGYLRPMALAIVPAMLVGGLLFWLMRVFFDVVGNGHPLTAPDAALLHLPLNASREEVLARACVILVVMLLLIAPLGMLVFGYAIWILQKISNLFRVSLYDRMQELSLRFHSEEKIGDAIFRTFQDSAAIPQVINGLLIQPIVHSPIVLANLLWLALLNYQMAIVAALMLPAHLLLACLFARPLRRAFLDSRETTAAAMSRIEETLASIKTVKAFGTETLESDAYERENWAAFMASRRARLTFAGYRAMANSIRGIAYVTVLYLGAHQVLTQGRGGLAGVAISLGLFQGAMIVFGRVSMSAQMLTRFWGDLQDVGVGMTRVFDLLERTPERESAGGSRIPPSSVDTLGLEAVNFSYDGRYQVLSGIDFRVRAGELTAIAGPSGSGKTTLISLLLRFFDPGAGRILLDGTDVREFDLAAYRRLFSVVLQESPLFTGSLRDNIAYSRPDARPGEIERAAAMAGLESFTNTLPRGFDTPLGEKGAKLSAGQAQRIGLARALLRGAPILLLDEPTSALDIASEEYVLAALRQWMNEGVTPRTVIMMTHRRTAAAAADRLFQISAGRLVEAAGIQDLPSGVDRNA